MHLLLNHRQVLTICGEHSETQEKTVKDEKSDRVFFRTERAKSNFARTFVVPRDVDANAIVARLNHGVLVSV